MSQFRVQDFRVSVNLLKACKRQLNFLKLVDSHPCLYQEGVVRRAVWRYEKFWMPLAANYTGKDEIVPPLDVHWVWHCHMLAPQYYRRDCMNMVGQIVPHKLLSSKEYSVAISRTEKLWKQKNNEEYHMDINNLINKDNTLRRGSVINYDILGAVSRQREFNYQVSLPHFKDDKFIENGILRYKMLLFLKKMHPEEFLAPYYDMDLAWHSHQLHPELYYKDTTCIFGKMLNHNDNPGGRSPRSKLARANERTRELWKLHFCDNTYSCSGAMYRGKPNFGSLSLLPKGLVKLICTKAFSVSLHQVKLKYNGDFDAKSKITIHFNKPKKMEILLNFSRLLTTLGDSQKGKDLVKDLAKFICSKTFSVSIAQFRLKYEGECDTKLKLTLDFIGQEKRVTLVNQKGPFTVWGNGQKPLVTFEYDTQFKGLLVDVNKKTGLFWERLCGSKVLVAPFIFEEEVQKTTEAPLIKSFRSVHMVS